MIQDAYEHWLDFHGIDRAYGIASIKQYLHDYLVRYADDEYVDHVIVTNPELQRTRHLPID